MDERLELQDYFAKALLFGTKNRKTGDAVST
jgi:hypothetical protein